MPKKIVGTNAKRLFFEKQAREQRRISGRAFGREAQIPDTSVTAYLNNDVTRFDSETIIKMMDYLGVKSFDEFFCVIEVDDETAKAK